VATRRILVVDDESTVREVITLCLQTLGQWEVIEAASGQEALHHVRQEDLDAIVLDLMMPEMDGLMFLQYLRRQLRTQNIPVVLLSGGGRFPEPEVLSELGVVLTIAKPFQPLELVQNIHQAMEW
jgi:CheY-like chemotaxis protein